MDSVALLTQNIRGCSLCAAQLPLGPRPVVQINAKARILIAGQAPGKKVHETGIPFDDASGERLRQWLGVTKTTFYDASQFAIVPMGFCYPGTGKSGDLPPRAECAAHWRRQVLDALINIQLTIVIGQYAIGYHLPDERRTLTETVRNWPNHWPQKIALPHPSPRNNIWLKRNPWFAEEVLPQLRSRVAAVLG
ncbi:uracil-DNA glycosylase family protein [Alteromonadaceae bacterium BrNp21-10]|nr:uracil-DNA glycosylase family protein [Alteromonadaceae bacterium BrNp21-10]